MNIPQTLIPRNHYTEKIRPYIRKNIAKVITGQRRVGNLAGQEIDVVAEKNNEKVYVQVALRIDDEATARREFGNLLKIQDNYPKIVVTAEDYSGNTYEGIRHYPLRRFLTDFT